MSYSENENLNRAVNQWEKGETDTISWEENGKTVFAPGTVKGKPIFQFLDMTKTFKKGGTMIAESENCVSFIPAGFRDGNTINTMNPVREEIGGKSSLMSLIHVITIPKKVRIYNACTLSKEHHVLLNEMKELGQKAVSILIYGDDKMIGSLKWLYLQTGNVVMKDGTQISQMIDVHKDISPKCLKSTEKYNFPVIESDEENLINSTKHSFHVFPAASIGWLHLHSYVGDLLTTAHDTMEREALKKGYKKNTPYEEIAIPLFCSMFT